MMMIIPMMARSSAVTFATMPSAETELFAQTNRRRKTNLSGYRYARVLVNGGVNGFNTSELRAQYSLNNGSSWQYLDGSGLPLTNMSCYNGNSVQFGSWAPIEAAAQTEVTLRVIGIGGNGVVNPTLTTVCIQFMSTPTYEGNSLENARIGRHYIMFGGSQMGGGGTAGTNPGNFGSLDVNLRSVPAGQTVIRDGVTLSVFSTGQHGAEAGFCAEMADQGYSTGLKLVERIEEGTTAANWTDTHLATLATDVTNAGITPCMAFYVGGGNDGNSDSSVGLYFHELRRLAGKVQELWPGCGLAVMLQVSEHNLEVPIENPKIIQARTVLSRFLQDPSNGLRCIVDGYNDIDLQSDNRHPISGGHVLQGRYFARKAIDAGIV